MRQTWVLALLVLAVGDGVRTAGGADPNADVPKEVRALEGTYTGSWTMYGLDEKGEVVKRMAWTDTIKAGGAEVKGGRAQVTTVDEMTFEGAKGPPFKVEGKEGYYLTKDGNLGEYFIETYGQIHRMVKLKDNVWTYPSAAAEQELTRLGFPKGASGEPVAATCRRAVDGPHRAEQRGRLGQLVAVARRHVQHDRHPRSGLVVARRCPVQRGGVPGPACRQPVAAVLAPTPEAGQRSLVRPVNEHPEQFAREADVSSMLHVQDGHGGRRAAPMGAVVPRDGTHEQDQPRPVAPGSSRSSSTRRRVIIRGGSDARPNGREQVYSVRASVGRGIR